MRSCHVGCFGSCLGVELVVLPFHFAEGEGNRFHWKFLALAASNVYGGDHHVFKSILGKNLLLPGALADLDGGFVKVFAQAAHLVEVRGGEIHPLREREVLNVHFACYTRRAAADCAGAMLGQTKRERPDFNPVLVLLVGRFALDGLNLKISVE